MKAVLLRQLNESRTYDNDLYMHQVFLTALENTPLLIVDPHLLKISIIPPTPFIMGVFNIRKHQSLPRNPLAINFGLLFFVAEKGINANLIPPGLLTRNSSLTLKEDQQRVQGLQAFTFSVIIV